MAWREVEFFYAAVEATGRSERLNAMGMAIVGAMWPYYRYVWWKLKREEKKDG